jgi:hypothetical protein
MRISEEKTRDGEIKFFHFTLEKWKTLVFIFSKHLNESIV